MTLDRCTKKYDTILKGFKVLEADYEKSKKNLAISEEIVHAACIAYAGLVSETEAVIHGREQVRPHPSGENLRLIFGRKFWSFVRPWKELSRF